VIVDGRLIFSKAAAGRFPVAGEVEGLFAALKPGTEMPAATRDADEPPEEPGGGGRLGMLRRLADRFRN
jgi:hypothetical protein